MNDEGHTVYHVDPSDLAQRIADLERLQTQIADELAALRKLASAIGRTVEQPNSDASDDRG